MYRTARKQAGLSIEEAAWRLNIAPRTLCKYEAEQTKPPPEVVKKMGEVYKLPAITQLHCRKYCPIGEYSYEVLNNVDLTPTAILTKYTIEAREVHDELERMISLVLNKVDAQDCTEEELAELKACAARMLNVEHVIETLKLKLWDFMDVGELIREHNRKCLERRYFDPDKPELVLAG